MLLRPQVERRASHRKGTRMARIGCCLLGGLLAALLSATSAFAVDRVYWAGYGNDKISFANLDGSGAGGDLNIGAATISEPLGVAIDIAAGRIYWTNDAAPNIGYAYLDGSGGGDVNTAGVTSVNPYAGIAVDPAGGKVYWGNYVPAKISFAKLDGSGGGGDLNTSGATLNEPSGVAVERPAGKIYWSNDGANKISFANLDGSGGGGDLNTGAATVNRPFGVALDVVGGKIYWANDGAAKISFANLDGSGGGDLDTTGTTVHEPEGVAVDHAAGRVYWANYSSTTISYANLDNTGGGGDIATTGATVSGPAFPVLLRAPSGAGVPTISGGSTPGSLLTCSTGTWTDPLSAFVFQSPAAFAYQWSMNGADIGGATASTYTAGQDGSYGCRVTASNQAGSTAQTSARFVVATPTPVPPAPSAPAKASFSVTPSVIKVDRKRRFSFSFGAEPALTGTAVFRSVKKVHISRRRVVTLARTSFSTPAAGKVTLRLRLSKENFRVLRLNHTIRTRVTVTLKNSAGLTSTASKVVALRAPRR
jgi:DNA-binding beta-propeller fold protein YncE